MNGSTSTQLECYRDFFEEKATGFKRPGSAVRFGTMYPRSNRPRRHCASFRTTSGRAGGSRLHGLLGGSVCRGPSSRSSVRK